MRTVALRDVLVPRNEIVHPRDRPSGNATFVGLEHIEPHTGRRIGSLPIRLEGLTGRKARFRVGDIVYGYLRPYLNKVWVADFDGYCSVDQYVFRHHHRIDPTYIAAFMRSPGFLRRAPVDITPGQLPRIRLDEVLDVRLHVPDFGRQQRLAEDILAAEAQATRLRASSGARLTTAHLLRQRMLDSALEPKPHWITVRIGDLASEPMRTGISGPESSTATMCGLSIGAVRRGALDLSVTKRVNVPVDTDRLVREGALYIVRGNGRLDLVGRAGVAPRPPSPVVFPDLLIELVPRSDLVDPGFLALLLDGSAVRHSVEGAARTSSGIHKVNIGSISRVEIHLPPRYEQRRIEVELRERLATIDAMTRAIDAQREAIGALPAALLRRAFGDLEAA